MVFIIFIYGACVAEFEMRVEGKKELQGAFNRIISNIKNRAEGAVDSVMKNTAEHIKREFSGRTKGFEDRTGALRASIKGGFLENRGNEIIGFVGAGDDTIGSNRKPTRDYVHFVELGEFYGHGHTSFLRAGMMEQSRKIAKGLIDFFKPEKFEKGIL